MTAFKPLLRPQFKHDCEYCRFVGILDGCDAYVCGSAVVLRKGSDGPDYISMPLEMAHKHEPYATVLRMGVVNAKS
jgi:hypothetical protein